MTREEAIAYGKRVIGLGLNDETQAFCELAIKALEPCEDAVSREFLLRDLLLKAQGEKDVSIKWLEEYINSLPSVTPQETFKPLVEIDLYSVIKQKYIEREVLDKIKAEISEYGSIWVAYTIKDTSTKGIEKLVEDVLKQAKEQVIDVIDKYKAESEVE